MPSFDEKASGAGFGLFVLTPEVAGAFGKGGEEFAGRFFFSFDEPGELGEELGVGGFFSGVGEGEEFGGPKILRLLMLFGTETGEFLAGPDGDRRIQLGDELAEGSGGVVVWEHFEVGLDLVPAAENDVASEYFEVIFESDSFRLVFTLLEDLGADSGWFDTRIDGRLRDGRLGGFVFFGKPGSEYSGGRAVDGHGLQHA